MMASARPARAAAPPGGQDWPQWRGAQRDGIWKETGLVSRFDGPEIKVKWRVPIANGFSGPTVADGRVYVTDRVLEPRSQERVHCFDWETGREIWSYAYDCDYRGVSVPDGPRASVTIHDGRAYSLGAMGHLYCFDAAQGTVLWSKDLNTAYRIRMPDWGIAAAPLIEGDLAIVMIGGSGNACLVAFDRKTGREAWHALPDRATYSAPIVLDQAGRRVLICWTAERLVGLDPQTGRLYWEYPWPSLANIDGITTPAVSGDRLFVTSVYEGSLMLRLRRDRPAIEKGWEKRGQNARTTAALQTMLATPILKGDYLYGIDYYGELRCLDSRTGARVWENTTVVPRAQWASAHLIQNGERVWIFNERGQLIIARLTPKGYEEISRAQLIKPTTGQLNQRGGVAWSHPAFAYQHVFARNDEELVCASLKAPVGG
jgi:outer membrane protein assembly factor BamB